MFYGCQRATVSPPLSDIRALRLTAGTVSRCADEDRRGREGVEVWRRSVR